VSYHRVCCCVPCACPETLTLELRGSLPIDIACPSNAPTSPPFATIGPYFDCTGSIDDQIETISIVSQGSGSNLPCYFSDFRRWCEPSSGSTLWPAIQDWNLNVSRSLCSGFSNVGGLVTCGSQFGSAPSTFPYGADQGYAVMTYQSSWDSVNSRHRIYINVFVPAYKDTNEWVGSTFNVRAYKASSARDCFPRGKYTLYDTANDNTHGWVETHITSFNNTTGAIVTTTTRNSVSNPPFEIWVS
jgi:hypothetical protein